MQVKKQQLETDLQQWFGSKLGKEYFKAVYLSLCYFNLHAEYIMWNAGLDRAQAGIRLVGKISITLDKQMTPPYGRKCRESKEPLDESERGEWKSWLKTQHSEI